ncbi:Alpha/beta hydrolase fold-1 [Thelonectria olida]|uniref:Alpha/beta hydrolase fold-1 n=1 Tax=Thelonectria olida TaxID=1576542 RepID=A0A9P9AK17_9HYPO|nr:Alpha/beta hydrolase fold-1 [Thelonectria olida]
MTVSRPTIVFAPGAWHTADCFDLARNALHARGWSTEAVDYPSVGAEPPTKGLHDDAAALRNTLTRLCDAGKEIILVVHSYGGLVGANAVEGLGYRQRRNEAKVGGVIMFVYMAAFVTPLGKSIKEMLSGQFLPWMNFQGEYVHPDTPEVVFYHDMDAGAQKKAIGALKHQSAPVFTDAVTYEPWQDIECMYFFCDEDKALPLPVQSQMAQLLGPKAVTFHTAASHSPFLSQVDDVVQGLEYAAKEGQERARV